ncbi:reverse transcriptase [Acinetobacter sp. Ac_877]|jgi:predicted CopG family antitoxin|uniref:reverse transcriptase domain-containing protein n=1 Tax=Acinetobacter portensis TaxID=1839785 RepID=UPI00128BD2E7|nr:reverse transcriptase domain-containing protein [Acinetobacter portensis]MPW40338.1 reverse transcriptase [Acinetobacter portensis]
MTFHDYIKENFIKSFFNLFNKQRFYLLNIKYYPEYLSFNEFNLNKEKILVELLDNLSKKNYSPQPLHPILMDKPDGSLRLICVPTIQDRIVQKLLLKYIKEHHKNKYILATNYDFSSKISEAGAIAARVKALELRNQYPFVLKTDISAFFDNLDRKLMKKNIEEKLNISEINFILEKIIKVDTRLKETELIGAKEIEFLKLKRGKGIRQGMPMSSFLASLYLYEFDTLMNDKKIPYVRYADDLVLFCSSRSEALKYLDLVREELKKIGLEIPPLEDKGKTNIFKNKPVDFLGLEFRYSGNRFKSYIPNSVFKTINNKLDIYDSLNKNLKNKKDFSDVIQDIKYISNGYNSAFSDACNMSELQEEINHKKIVIFSKLLKSLGLDIERLSARQKKFFFSL